MERMLKSTLTTAPKIGMNPFCTEAIVLRGLHWEYMCSMMMPGGSVSAPAGSAASGPKYMSVKGAQLPS